MEEFIEVRFASSEDEFIYQSGVNRGHVQIPLKIVNCLLITSSERHLYDLLRGFMYGEKRSCFPSIEVLLGLSGWSRTTFKKHLAGLIKADLVDYTVREGTTNLYILKEVHKSTTIVHSEMLHQIREELFGRMAGRFYSLKDNYMESKLYIKIRDAVNPLEYYDELKSWFAAGGFVNLPQQEEKNEPTIEETPKSPSIEQSPAPNKNNLLIKMAANAKKMTAITGDEELKKVADPDKEVKKKKSKASDYKLLSLEEWNIHHFFRYFEDTYVEKLNFPMAVHKGDLAQLRALLERYKNENLKSRIELFFESKHFEKVTKNIYSFSSAFTQSKIDKLLNFDSSNSYMSNEHGQLDDDEQKQMAQWMKEMGIEE
ncbi:hypothetical protein ACPA0F_18110 [Solibacillus silvestris]